MSLPVDSGLYFIAWIPQGQLLQELEQLKSEFASEFNVHRALKSPPHITFQMPFRWSLKREAVLLKSLTTLESHSFELRLKGFGAFAPRVLFIQPQESADLRNLYAEVQVRMRSIGIHQGTYRNQGFEPHITIAHGDLKKPVFLKAWEEYSNREFSAQQTVRSISLLKHDGRLWQVVKNFDLKDN